MLRPKDLCQGSGTKTFLEAMHSGKVHLARFVLDALDGRIINSKTENSRTPLMFAVCLQDNGSRSKFTQLLLEKGAEVNDRDEHGRSSLSLACELGHLDAVKLLVQFNADPELADTWGNSPLMYAAYGGHNQVLEFLIRAFKRLGLQLDQTNQAGHSAIQVANYFGHSQCVQALNGFSKKATVSADLTGEMDGQPSGEPRQPNRLPKHILERFSRQVNGKSEELPALFQRQLITGDSRRSQMQFRCQTQSQDRANNNNSTLTRVSEGSLTEDGQCDLFASEEGQHKTLRDLKPAKKLDFSSEHCQAEHNTTQQGRENLPLWGKARSFNLDLRAGRKQSYQGDVREVSQSVSKVKRASLPLIAKFYSPGNGSAKTNDADKPAKAPIHLLEQFPGVQEDGIREQNGENNDITLSNRRGSQKRCSIPHVGRQNKLLFNREEMEPARIKVCQSGLAGLGTRLMRRFTAPEFMRLVRDSSSGSAQGKGKISRSETFPLSHTHQKVNSQPSIDSISAVRCEFESSSTCVSLT